MFRTSQPVLRAEFFDRSSALERLQRLIAQLAAGGPEWLAIIGPRKVGKTSLLLEAARRFESEAVVFVVFDILDSMPVSLEVFRRLAVRVLDAFIDDAGAAPSRMLGDPTEFRRTMLRSRRFAKLDRELQAAVLELPERNADEGLVRDSLELAERLAAATGVRVLLAIDEFQELAGLGNHRGAPDPLPLMRSLWQRHRHVAYVISGSARSTLTELVTSEHSPFFQHFALMELGAFEHADAVTLLTASAPEDRPIPRALAERAVKVLGGHPFYLQIFGESLTALQPPYDERSLKEALQSTLFSRTGRLALYFENEHQRLVGRSTGQAATLDALAEGPLRLTDVARRIGGSTATANQYVQRLADAVRARDDGLYELADPTFAIWVRWRRPGGAITSMRTVGDEAEIAVAEHLSRMGFDLVYQSRGSRGAFDLLATRGSDQLGVQVKRRALPLRFTRAEWNRMAADAKKWGWRWIVAAVSTGGEIALLDPAGASRKKEVRLGEASRIEDLLGWLA